MAHRKSRAARLHRAWAACTVAIALAGCASAPEPGTRIGPAMVQSTTIGAVLADSHGMTLYTHKDDDGATSTCYGRCAKAWPPFLAAVSAKPTGNFTLATRKDGTVQWAYEGRPLYLWTKDRQPGDATGDKYGDVWYVARP
jgi:predicted lipoprotein with Yx(FWY)xxD motif